MMFSPVNYSIFLAILFKINVLFGFTLDYQHEEIKKDVNVKNHGLICIVFQIKTSFCFFGDKGF